MNWRRLGTEDPYPRYDHVRSNFVTYFPAFERTVGERLQVPLVPEWCEVTYINEIEAQPESGFGHMELSRILCLFGERLQHEVLPAPEDSQFQERFVLRRDEEPYGRFYLSATPAFRNVDGVAVYMITLLVRGKPATPDHDGILALFDDGHDRIVRTFKEITTEEMHERWGLQE
jgi:uncharacterized protein (TIGR04255 family)